MEDKVHFSSICFRRDADSQQNYFLEGLFALPLPLGLPVVDGYIGPGHERLDIVLCVYLLTMPEQYRHLINRKDDAKLLLFLDMCNSSFAKRIFSPNNGINIQFNGINFLQLTE